MAEKKKPDDSQMPFKEVKRRTLLHLDRIQQSRDRKAQKKANNTNKKLH